MTELPSATVIAGLKAENASAAGPAGASGGAAVPARAVAADGASSLDLGLGTRRRATATGYAIRSFIYAPVRLEMIAMPVARLPRRRVCSYDIGAPRVYMRHRYSAGECAVRRRPVFRASPSRAIAPILRRSAHRRRRDRTR